MTDHTDDVRAAFDAAEDVTPLEGSPRGAGLSDAPPPLDASGGGVGYGAPGQEDSAPEPPEAKGAALPLNDTGNGLRFALYCGDDALHVPRVGWHIWDGKRWKLDPDGIAVRRHAQTIHERIGGEVWHLQLTGEEQRFAAQLEAITSALGALDAPDGDAMTEEERLEKRQKLSDDKEALTAKLWGKGSSRARHMAFAKSAGNSNNIKNMMLEATTSLGRDVEDLDADPLTVNTQSGVLRFSKVRDEHAAAFPGTDGAKRYIATIALQDHQRVSSIEGRNAPQYITKMMPVDYDPKATCPEFDAFLSRVVPDAEMRGFLARWFGASMTGVPIQKFLYMYGMGANGKSLLANLMRRMLGDYATMVKIESLIGQNRKSGSDATPDLFRLIGARAAITSEPPENERLQEGKLKEMTGGDEMLVRTLHADFVAFTPYFKLTFTGNHKLEIRGTDDGIWRRPMLFPFDVQIPEAERDEGLGDRLFDQERPGILNWMIAGLMDFLEGGLQEPDQVRQATEEYRKDSDPIGDFLASQCIMDGGSDFLPARDLVDACYLYLLENTAHAWQPGNLQRKLKERSGKYMHPATSKTFVRHKRNGVWGYTGVRLVAKMHDDLHAAQRDAKGLPMLPKTSGDGGGYRPSDQDYPL